MCTEGATRIDVVQRVVCLTPCREIERTGGLTGTVRDDVLFVMDALIKLANNLDPDLGLVFSQILVSIVCDINMHTHKHIILYIYYVTAAERPSAYDPSLYRMARKKM